MMARRRDHDFMSTTEPDAGGASSLDLESLSDREREVRRAALIGASGRGLAARLSLSEATVRSHLSHIYGKRGCRRPNRTSRARQWSRSGRGRP